MGYMAVGVFFGVWIAVAKAYGKRGITGVRRQLMGFCLGIVGMVTSVAIVSLMIDAKDGGVSAPASEHPGARAQLITARAGDLYDAYEANEVSADQKYKGKDLQITGTVQSIDKDAFGNIVIRLKTSNQFMPVSATLDDAHEASAARMSKDDIITVECTGAGRIIGSPALKDCRPG